MKLASPYQKKRARIEIIPLIDIVFFLLATFVMVSMSMVKNQGVEVKLPVAKTASKQSVEHAFTVTVKQDGTLFLDKTPTSIKALTAVLQQSFVQNPEMQVIIQGDEKADLGHAIAVLDAVRLVGIHSVSIRTRSL